MKKTEALITAATETFTCFFKPQFWTIAVAGMAAIGGALMWLSLRVLMIITFPISIPLMAWAIYADDRKYRKQAEEAMRQMREGRPQNGQVKP